MIYLTIGGWDTHTGQIRRHQQLLGELGSGLTALDRDIQAHNMQKNVLIIVQSEFGRRPAENVTGGTDHGTAAPVMLLGNVRGGLYGGTPALDKSCPREPTHASRFPSHLCGDSQSLGRN